MTLDYWLVLFFIATMIANIVALVRHWQMMRVMNIMLTGFAETQNQFNEIMQEEQRQRREQP